MPGYHKKQAHTQRRSAQPTLGTMLSLIFVPSRQNQYRPYLVRKWTILTVVALVAVSQLGLHQAQTGQVMAGKTTVSTGELLRYTNRARVKAGVAPLALDNELNQAASSKLDDMFLHQYWDHVSPAGVQPWYWIEQVGYDYRTAGENLAKNFYNAPSMVQAWYDSPPHKENLLSDKYSEVGFATASGKLEGQQVTITVAMYAQPQQTGMVLAATPKAVYAGSPSATFAASGVNAPLGAVDRIGVAVQAMPPAVIGMLVLLLVMMLVLVAAHFSRHRLPKSRTRHQLYRHHALVKGLGVFTLVVATFWMYGGGQV